MQGWVSEDKKYQPIGAERFVVSWFRVSADALGKDDIDPDEDIKEQLVPFATKEAAMKRAKLAVEDEANAWGGAKVTQQVVEWLWKPDGVAEWVDVGDGEYLG